jgi:hypothetical protein
MTPLARCGDREPLDLALGERQRQADRQHGVDGQMMTTQQPSVR